MQSFPIRAAALLACVFLYASPAAAGPPFDTDDPEPTETGHCEIYAPAGNIEGVGGDFSGATGIELNYGAAPNLQLTVGIEAGYSHDAAGWRWGAGDLAVSAKYRFYHDDANGIQIAAFPGITLPTATNGQGAGRVTALLPVWVQKDSGAWSVFGGGGYAINPGPGNRDYWTGGIALTRQVTPGLLLGIEADRHGADTVGGGGVTSLGVGLITISAGAYGSSPRADRNSQTTSGPPGTTVFLL